MLGAANEVKLLDTPPPPQKKVQLLQFGTNKSNGPEGHPKKSIFSHLVKRQKSIYQNLLLTKKVRTNQSQTKEEPT